MEEIDSVLKMEWEQKQVGYVRECLNLADIFWPGYSRCRGIHY